MSSHRLRQTPPELLEKCRKASPPPPAPRGFFDALVTPTRLLLDNGLKLHQAADFLIEERALKPVYRTRYLNALRVRMTRFRAKTAKAGEVFRWRTALGYETAHAVGNGTVALCGARASRWMGSTELTRNCRQCIGIVRIQNITIPREM